MRAHGGALNAHAQVAALQLSDKLVRSELFTGLGHYNLSLFLRITLVNCRDYLK